MSDQRGLSQLEVFRRAEELSDEVWDIVKGWDSFSKNTVGKQLVRAAYSVGANIAEGVGRFTYRDNARFVRIARGSLYEVRFWLRRAHHRGLIQDDHVALLKEKMDVLPPMLNAYLKSLSTRGSKHHKVTHEE